MAKISIIIPVYNVEKYIGRCLDSCINQNGVSIDDYEIVVVNDGTLDNSMEIVRQYEAKFPNIVVVEQENKGVGGARNTGIVKATGDYIQFLDSDDRLSLDDVKTIIGIMGKDKPDIIALSAKNDYTGNIRNQLPVYIQSGKELLRSGLFPHCSVFFVYSKSFLECRGLQFVEHIYHEDSEFTPRALYFAEKLKVCDEILYYVNDEPHSSITRSVNIKKCYDNITVAENLKAFTENEIGEDDIKRIFYRTCALMINNALRHSRYFNIEKRKEVDMFLDKKRYLLPVFWKGDKLMHRIEYLLLHSHCAGGAYCAKYYWLSKMKDKMSHSVY